MEHMEAIRHVTAREQYLRMHKRPVGPKTAERLFFLYGEISLDPDPGAQHMAGWAAAEAALVSTDRPRNDRLTMLDAAEESWNDALRGYKEFALRKSLIPNRSAEMHMRKDLVFIPAMRHLILHRFDHEIRKETYDNLLELAIENIVEMHDAQQAGDTGRYSNRSGLANEYTHLLAGNRLLSGRVFFLPSFARSGSGDYYPSQTHDLQAVNLRRGRFTTVTPLESKASSISPRYKSPIVSGRRHLNTTNPASFMNLYEALLREREGVASPDEIQLADTATRKVFHLIRHHYRPEELGYHCLNIDRCMRQTDTHNLSQEAAA